MAKTSVASFCTLSSRPSWQNTLRRGEKRYEMTNHLGNVLATVTDRKVGLDSDGNGIAEAYRASVAGVRDYYPFGASIASRTVTDNYRYSFNGKESDSEVGFGWQNYGFRLYEEEIGRFLSVDPLTASYPMLTPYQFSSNTPIWAIDLDGLEAQPTTDQAKVTPLPLIVVETAETVATKTPWWQRGLGAIGSRGLGVLGLVLTPTEMGNPTPYWLHPSYNVTSHIEIYTNNPGSLSDDYLEGVRSRLLKGNGSLQDLLYSQEAYVRPGRAGRKRAFEKFSPDWETGSFSGAIEKFAPGAKGIISKDGVKISYTNPETGTTVKYDTENDYFRIISKDSQYLQLDGTQVKTGDRLGKDASNYEKKKTHFLNTDKS